MRQVVREARWQARRASKDGGWSWSTSLWIAVIVVGIESIFSLTFVQALIASALLLGAVYGIIWIAAHNTRSRREVSTSPVQFHAVETRPFPIDSGLGWRKDPELLVRLQEITALISDVEFFTIDSGRVMIRPEVSRTRLEDISADQKRLLYHVCAERWHGSTVFVDGGFGNGWERLSP
ncbi:MAG TPA: hypothetical protein VIJ12_02555 [Candidatus Baltobacteraceae bacterium]